MSIPASVVIGGLSSGHARKDADFYPTPPDCTEALLATWAAPHHIWEPSCGDGAISRILKARGHDVTSTDLHARGYGHAGIDFLSTKRPRHFDGIVTNPPFNLAEAFIRRSRTFGVPFAMLLKATYWHAKTRRRLFEETGPAAVFAMLWRPNFVPERGNAPTMDVIWTVWSAKPASDCRYYLLDKPKAEA